MHLRINRFLIGICALALWAASSANAQSDTIVVFDCKTGDITFCKVPLPDNQQMECYTPSYKGDLPNVVALSNDKPAVSHPNSEFTIPGMASACYPLNSYPVRTAVKIYYFRNDTIYDLCSGTLVASNMVLTSGHCLYDVNENPKWFDSLLVIPAYNNGISDPLVGMSSANKLFILKSFYNNDQWDDVGLIELEEPIGHLTGWAGFGYHTKDSFYFDNVFHCFSYPAVPGSFDLSQNYNGDDMFYQVGCLDQLNKDYLGVNVVGIPGQSGSGLLFEDLNKHVIYGVRTFSGPQSFFRINPTVFHALNYIMEGQQESSIDFHHDDIIGFKLLPAIQENQWIYVCISESEKSLDLQMLDQQGNLVWDEEIKLIKGINTGELDLSDFEEINYQLLIRNGAKLVFSDFLNR